MQFYKEKKEGIEIMCRILDAERMKGFEEGFKEGFKKGFKEGFNEGLYEKPKMNIINQLNRRLLYDNREEDIILALANPVYQAELLQEYQL